MITFGSNFNIIQEQLGAIIYNLEWNLLLLYVRQDKIVLLRSDRGSVFHFIKGTYNSPTGRRFAGGAQAVTMNDPRLGGHFAAYGGLLSTFNYTMVYIRKKEDPWNLIIAGAATGGLLSMRKGIVAASTSAVMVGVLLVQRDALMLNK